MEIVEAAILRDKIGIERFEQDTAGNLRSDHILQPGGAAPGRPSHEDAFTRIRLGVDVDAAGNLLNGAPIKFP